jgi:hypothetical protein
MNDFSSEVKRILHENDCYFVRRGNGDHDIWYSPISKRRFPVDAKIKSRHTANGIMKQAGLPKAFWSLVAYPVLTKGVSGFDLFGLTI